MCQNRPRYWGAVGAKTLFSIAGGGGREGAGNESSNEEVR